MFNIFFKRDFLSLALSIYIYSIMFFFLFLVFKAANQKNNLFFRLLLKENVTRRRRCISSIWWKVFVWIGANLLIFGTVGVLVGYLVPQKTVIVAETEDNYDILDNQAINFNMNLDVCKLVGLILFCIGGLTLTVALLVPTIVVPKHEPPPPDIDTTLTSVSDYQDQPRSPPPVPVDSLTTVKQVQPARKEQESVATQAAGMVPLAASVTQ